MIARSRTSTRLYVSLRPDFAEAYCDRGVAYSKKRDCSSAIKDYSKAIELNPAYSEAYYNRSADYSCKGEHDHTIQDLDRAIELNPRYTNA